VQPGATIVSTLTTSSWSTTWTDGAAGMPQETYSLKCVVYTGSSTCTDTGVGTPQTGIARGVQAGSIFDLPASSTFDCFVIADNGVGSPVCSAAVSVTTGAGSWHVNALTLPSAPPGIEIGISVASSGNGLVVAIGAPDALAVAHPGYVYVYERTSRLSPFGSVATTLTSGSNGADFGAAVSVDAAGDMIAIGAPLINVFGGAYTIAKPQGGWAQATSAGLVSVNPSPALSSQVDFGYSIALSADASTLVVGSPAATCGGTCGQGSAWVFQSTGAVWNSGYQIAAIPPGPPQFSYTGYAVAVAGNAATGATIAIGAFNMPPRSSGAVFIEEGSGTTWVQSQVTPAGVSIPTFANYGEQLVFEPLGSRSIRRSHDDRIV